MESEIELNEMLQQGNMSIADYLDAMQKHPASHLDHIKAIQQKIANQ